MTPPRKATEIAFLIFTIWIVSTCGFFILSGRTMAVKRKTIVAEEVARGHEEVRRYSLTVKRSDRIVRGNENMAIGYKAMASIPVREAQFVGYGYSHGDGTLNNFRTYVGSGTYECAGWKKVGDGEVEK